MARPARLDLAEIASEPHQNGILARTLPVAGGPRTRTYRRLWTRSGGRQVPPNARPKTRLQDRSAAPHWCRTGRPGDYVTLAASQVLMQSAVVLAAAMVAEANPDRAQPA
jgi:hypothetical protein